MKKLLFTLFVLIASATGMQAQELYKNVYDKAMAVVNNPASSDEATQINQFKLTALNYMSMMVKKRGLKKDSDFYNAQAVMLNSFITDFQVNLEKARAISSAKRTKILEIYTNASKFNPMFNDPDKEKVNCYVNDRTTLTPFCIDTDWVKAYDQATTMAKAELR